MKLEDQVVRLELAKKLKELGVNQESLFEWRRFESLGAWSDWQCGLVSEDLFPEETVAAFTVAELGEIISWNINNYEWTIHIAPKFSIDGSWVLWFEDEDGKKKRMYKNGDWYIADRNEADARAKMLIYLIENNLLDVAAINTTV